MRGKVVLITGSSVGIGRYTAYEFAKSGAKLTLTYCKDEEEGKKTLSECVRLGSEETILLHLNLLKNESIKECVRKTVERFGRIDILVNNAGVLAWKPLREQSFEEIENQIRVNLEGLIKMTKEAHPYLREVILNIGSGAGKTGFSELTTYCAAKFGVRELLTVNYFPNNI